jgi:hypothetical protein
MFSILYWRLRVGQWHLCSSSAQTHSCLRMTIVAHGSHSFSYRRWLYHHVCLIRDWASDTLAEPLGLCSMKTWLELRDWVEVELCGSFRCDEETESRYLTPLCIQKSVSNQFDKICVTRPPKNSMSDASSPLHLPSCLVSASSSFQRQSLPFPTPL